MENGERKNCHIGVVVPKRVHEWKEGVVKRELLTFHAFAKQIYAFDYLDKQQCVQEKDCMGHSVDNGIEATAKKISPHNWEPLAENIRNFHKLNGGSGSKATSRSKAPKTRPKNISSQHMMPFSMELVGGDGTWYRRYAAATYSSILTRCKDKKRSHYYEVIREGYPCHMYFDLEYSMEGNQSLDGNQMVDNLLLKLDTFLKYVSAPVLVALLSCVTFQTLF